MFRLLFRELRKVEGATSRHKSVPNGLEIPLLGEVGAPIDALHGDLAHPAPGAEPDENVPVPQVADQQLQQGQCRAFFRLGEVRQVQDQVNGIPSAFPLDRKSTR